MGPRRPRAAGAAGRPSRPTPPLRGWYHASPHHLRTRSLLTDLPDPDAPVVHVHTRARGGLGTISRRDLDARIHRGEVAPDDVFWFPGMAAWGEVRHHPELFADLSPAVPPPSVLSDVMVALPGAGPDAAAAPPSPGVPAPAPAAHADLEPPGATPVVPAPAASVPPVGLAAPVPPAALAAPVPPAELAAPHVVAPHVAAPHVAGPPPAALSAPEPLGGTVASIGHTPSSVPPAVEVADSTTWIAPEPPPPAAAPPPPEPRSVTPDADALVPTDTELGFLDDPSILDEPGAAEGADLPTYVAETPEDDRMDAIFDDLMQATWDYREAHEFASCIDEVFLGAVITAALDAGRVLTDLTSDGTHHFLRFVAPDDGSRVLLRLTHLTGNLTTSRVQGHMASVVVGYGERMARFAEIWAALGEERGSGLVPRDTPGAMVIDGDVASQYVYAQVRLFLRIDDYVQRDWTIDYHRLSEHIAACVRALRIHLVGRFG